MDWHVAKMGVFVSNYGGEVGPLAELKAEPGPRPLEHEERSGQVVKDED